MQPRRMTFAFLALAACFLGGYLTGTHSPKPCATPPADQLPADDSLGRELLGRTEAEVREYLGEPRNMADSDTPDGGRRRQLCYRYGRENLLIYLNADGRVRRVTYRFTDISGGPN